MFVFCSLRCHYDANCDLIEFPPMDWLSNHFWQLFSGVGGTALVALLVFWLERRRRNSTKGSEFRTSSAVTVRDSQLTGSPVASGSQITQQNYFTSTTPQPATPAPTTVAPTAEAKPQPNILMTRAMVFPVNEFGPTRFTEDPTGKAEAFVIEFTNEARHDQQSAGATVKASLVYERNDIGILRVIGIWMRNESDTQRFEVEDTHQLVVGIFFNNEFTTIHMRTVGGYVRAEPYVVPAFQTVRVRLTRSNGVLLYEGRFRVTLDPLAIVQEITGHIETAQ